MNAWWKSGSDKAKFSTRNTEHYNIGDEEQEEGGRVPNSYPDQFSGDRDGPTIKKWQRAVDLWREGEGRRVPVSVVGPRVLKMLYGTAALVCSELDAKDVNSIDGLDRIYRMWETSPLIKELEDVRGDAVQREFMAMRRQSGESLDAGRHCCGRRCRSMIRSLV